MMMVMHHSVLGFNMFLFYAFITGLFTPEAPLVSLESLSEYDNEGEPSLIKCPAVKQPKLMACSGGECTYKIILKIQMLQILQMLVNSFFH